MAKRPVFYVNDNNQWVKENVLFEWFPGFAKSQALKSVQSLQDAFRDQHPEAKVLEVSSVSPEEWGQAASAFNLTWTNESGKKYTVEQMFQAGKVFEKNGSQRKLLDVPSNEAKARIKKLNKVDRLVRFQLFKDSYGLEPKTYFYNWLYLRTLHKEENQEIANEVLKYDAFTDIYFNPKKSINCQAEACSIYVALSRQGRLDEVLNGRETFKDIVYPHPHHLSLSKDLDKQGEQLSLFEDGNGLSQ